MITNQIDTAPKPIVALNCEEVPVTREDALKRVRLEMSRHDIDRVILLTRGGAIDDIKK